MRTLYHGTSSINLDCIKTVGLEPGHAKGGVVYAQQHHMAGIAYADKHRDPSVFVAISQEKAEDFAFIAVEEMGGTPVVIVLKVPDAVFVTFHVDEAYDDSDDPHAWMAPRIPAECVERVIHVKHEQPSYERLDDIRSLLLNFLAQRR